MDFGGDFGSVLVEKNVWPFLVEKMGSPPRGPDENTNLETVISHKLIDTVFFEHLNFVRLFVDMCDNSISHLCQCKCHYSRNLCRKFDF